MLTGPVSIGSVQAFCPFCFELVCPLLLNESLCVFSRSCQIRVLHLLPFCRSPMHF